MHEELMQFVNDMEFDRLGAFAYSREEGTPAAEMPGQIDEERKADWQAEVMELQEEVIFDKNESMKGTELFAFIEGSVADEPNTYVGRTYRDAPGVDGYIFVNTDEELVTGDIARVEVTGAYEYDLIGKIVKK
jgi:ribosomal protein S12 methylthiotransferase